MKAPGMVRGLVFDEVVLEKGAHSSPQDGMCVMEATAWIAGELFSDHPQCVSPVLGAFLRNWNDSVNDAFRQKLKTFIPRIVGTNDEQDEARAWMATDWLVRVCAPAWLDLAKLTQHAMALRTAERIRDAASAGCVQPLLNDARDDSYKAGAAVWAAAWAAACDTAEAAAWAAAWEIAGAAVWAAAWAAACDTAEAAAWNAVRNAARAAARAAAWAAAWAALQPTVELLQASALELLERMIDPKTSESANV